MDLKKQGKPATGATADDLAGRGVPKDIAEGLVRVRGELERAAGDNLVGLLLYGGLSRGRYRPGRSDVNVAVILRDASSFALSAIAPSLKHAFLALRLEPFVVTATEIRRSADVFPTKFLDIQRHHLLLCGEDPFQGLVISREHLRLRVEQELRNLSLRLRRRYLSVYDDEGGMTLALVDVAVPLAVNLAGLLDLAGKDAPADDALASTYEKAAAAFGLNLPVLLRLAEVRRSGMVGEDARSLLEAVLAALVRAAEAADRLEVAG